MMKGPKNGMDDTFDVTLRTAVYRHFATTGQSPTLDAIGKAIGATSEQVRDGYRRLYAKRMLVPAGDFASIRMAPPFSGVPTQHRVTVNGTEYFANCAWDAFGVVAALGGTGACFLPLRAHTRTDCPASHPGRTAALGMAVPLRGSSDGLVERHRVHVKPDAVLPVGRDIGRMVQSPSVSAAPHRDASTALADGHGVVCEPSECPSASA